MAENKNDHKHPTAKAKSIPLALFICLFEKQRKGLCQGSVDKLVLRALLSNHVIFVSKYFTLGF